MQNNYPNLTTELSVAPIDVVAYDDTIIKQQINSVNDQSILRDNNIIEQLTEHKQDNINTFEAVEQRDLEQDGKITGNTTNIAKNLQDITTIRGQLSQKESLLVAGSNIVISDNGDGTKTISVDNIELFIIVDVLPDSGTIGKVYLVKNEATNELDEWAWINDNGIYRWEQLGTLTIDLSNYYNKSETENIVANAIIDSETKSNNTYMPRLNTSDDIEYVSKNGQWSPKVESFIEAPIDGQQWARKNAAWDIVAKSKSVWGPYVGNLVGSGVTTKLSVTINDGFDYTSGDLFLIRTASIWRQGGIVTINGKDFYIWNSNTGKTYTPSTAALDINSILLCSYTNDGSNYGIACYNLDDQLYNSGIALCTCDTVANTSNKVLQGGNLGQPRRGQIMHVTFTQGVSGQIASFTSNGVNPGNLALFPPNNAYPVFNIPAGQGALFICDTRSSNSDRIWYPIMPNAAYTSLEEAPNDNYAYSRKNNTWIRALENPPTSETSVFARINDYWVGILGTRQADQMYTCRPDDNRLSIVLHGNGTNQCEFILPSTFKPSMLKVGNFFTVYFDSATQSIINVQAPNSVKYTNTEYATSPILVKPYGIVHFKCVYITDYGLDGIRWIVSGDIDSDSTQTTKTERYIKGRGRSVSGSLSIQEPLIDLTTGETVTNIQVGDILHIVYDDAGSTSTRVSYSSYDLFYQLTEYETMEPTVRINEISYDGFSPAISRSMKYGEAVTIKIISKTSDMWYSCIPLGQTFSKT